MIDLKPPTERSTSLVLKVGEIVGDCHVCPPAFASVLYRSPGRGPVQSRQEVEERSVTDDFTGGEELERRPHAEAIRKNVLTPTYCAPRTWGWEK